MFRYWFCRCFYHCPKCPERDRRRCTVTSTTCVVSPTSNTFGAPNPSSHVQLLPGATHLPTTTTNAMSESDIISNNELLPSTTNSSSWPASSPGTQNLLFWIFVPTSLVSSSQLLLGEGSETATVRAASSHPLQCYHGQRQ